MLSQETVKRKRNTPLLKISEIYQSIADECQHVVVTSVE